MNERIKELVGRAGGIGHDDDGNELTPALVGKDLEKFAELIVEKMYCFMCNATDNDKPWPTFKEVKQHFGVEE